MKETARIRRRIKEQASDEARQSKLLGFLLDWMLSDDSCLDRPGYSACPAGMSALPNPRATGFRWPRW